MSDPHQASRFVREFLSEQASPALEPRIGLILGSGLGAFAERLSEPGLCELPYADIPGFPASSVGGHRGRLVVGHLNGKQGPAVACLDGRAHVYEGHGADQVVMPTRMLALLGVEVLVITNAAGGVSPDLNPGDLMLIEDHINFSGHNPLRGPNDDALGPRFPDMTAAYDPELRDLARKVATDCGLPLAGGVYAVLGGPSYETPAEVRAIRSLGADAVGMSTVFETTAAAHAGMRVLGFSLITNQAAGLGDGHLSHDEVLETAAQARDRLVAYLEQLVTALHSSR